MAIEGLSTKYDAKFTAALIPHINLSGREYYFHFTEKETKAERVPVTSKGQSKGCQTPSTPQPRDRQGPVHLHCSWALTQETQATAG